MRIHKVQRNKVRVRLQKKGTSIVRKRTYAQFRQFYCYTSTMHFMRSIIGMSDSNVRLTSVLLEGRSWHDNPLCFSVLGCFLHFLIVFINFYIMQQQIAFSSVFTFAFHHSLKNIYPTGTVFSTKSCLISSPFCYSFQYFTLRSYSLELRSRTSCICTHFICPYNLVDPSSIADDFSRYPNTSNLF